MIEEKRKRVAIVFGVITVFTALILFFLFFFYSGLEVADAKLDQGTLLTTLENPSLHAITEIKVYYQDELQQLHLVQEEPLLLPGNKIEVALDQSYIVNDKIVLVIEAAFNQSLKKTFSISKGFGVKLKPALNAPSALFINQPATLEFEVCNEGIALDAVTLELSFNEAFFQSNASQENFPLRRNECVSKQFTFLPKQTGLSVIHFNINALDFSDEIKYSAEVR